MLPSLGEDAQCFCLVASSNRQQKNVNLHSIARPLKEPLQILYSANCVFSQSNIAAKTMIGRQSRPPDLPTSMAALCNCVIVNKILFPYTPCFTNIEHRHFIFDKSHSLFETPSAAAGFTRRIQACQLNQIALVLWSGHQPAYVCFVTAIHGQQSSYLQVLRRQILEVSRSY
jgi:hypothetical protein